MSNFTVKKLRLREVAQVSPMVMVELEPRRLLPEELMSC